METPKISKALKEEREILQPQWVSLWERRWEPKVPFSIIKKMIEQGAIEGNTAEGTVLFPFVHIPTADGTFPSAEVMYRDIMCPFAPDAPKPEKPETVTKEAKVRVFFDGDHWSEESSVTVRVAPLADLPLEFSPECSPCLRANKGVCRRERGVKL